MPGVRPEQRGLWEADRSVYLNHVGRDTFFRTVRL